MSDFAFVHVLLCERKHSVNGEAEDAMDSIREAPLAMPAAVREPANEHDDGDAALVRAARTDPTAFAVLYDRYVDRIYAYLRMQVAQDADAADLLQGVFLQAYNGLPRYRGDGTYIVAWLFRIARNAVIDARRRQRPTLPWDLVPSALQPFSTDEPEARALRREERTRLQELIDALDDQQRDLLVLRFTARLTIAEIAVVISKSEAATQKKLYRIIQGLKEAYNHDH